MRGIWNTDRSEQRGKDIHAWEKKTLKPRLRALSELRNFSVPMLAKQSGHPLGRCLRHNASEASLPLLSIRRLFSDALACYRNVQCAIRDAGEALFTITKKKELSHQNAAGFTLRPRASLCVSASSSCSFFLFFLFSCTFHPFESQRAPLLTSIS